MTSLPQINLTPSFGALLIGTVISICFLGVTTLQSWLYFQKYPKDPKGLKVMVATVLALEYFHSILAMHAVYTYLVLNWGTPSALARSVWSLDATLFVTATIEGIAHTFFMYRVYKLNGNKLLMPVIIGFMALNNFAFTLTTFALSVVERFFSDFTHTISVTSTTALAFAAAADISIAGSLWFYLHRQKTGVPRDNHYINQLIFYAINMGMLTGLADIAVLLCSELINGSSLAYLAIYEVVGNLYANSLLATLNTRKLPVINDPNYSLQLSAIPLNMPGSTNEAATYPYPDEIPDGQVDQSIAMTPIDTKQPNHDSV